MTKRNRSILQITSVLLVFLSITFIARAQTTTIKGTIQGANGQTLAGASVQLQGSKTGTVADNNGNYSLAVTPGKHILVVSFAGYTTSGLKLLYLKPGQPI